MWPLHTLVVFGLLANEYVDAYTNSGLALYVSSIARQQFAAGRPVFVSLHEQTHVKQSGYDHIGVDEDEIDIAVLRQIYSTEKWPLILSRPNVTKEKPCKDQVKAESYVIFVSNNFLEQITLIASHCSWNPRGNFVLVTPPSYKTDIVTILDIMWAFKVVNAVTVGKLLEQTTEVSNNISFGIYTWFPYQHQNVCEDVYDAILIHSCNCSDCSSVDVNVFPEKINKDLKGCPLTTVTEEFPPYAEGERVVVDENNETHVEYEYGWEIQMMITLAAVANLTPIYRLPIGDCNGKVSRFDVFPFFLCAKTHAALSSLMLLLQRTEVADATVFYDSSVITWHVPCSRKISRKLSISRVLSTPTWCTLALSVLVASLAFTFLARDNRISTQRWLASSFSHAFASLLGYSVTTLSRSNPVRVFFIFWIWYSFTFDILLQSFLTTFLVVTGEEHAISSVEELFSSDLKLLILKSFELHFDEEIFSNSPLFQSRIIRCNGFLKGIEYIQANAHKGNLAVLAGKTTMEENERSNTSENTLCPLEGGTLYRTMIVLYLDKGSPLLGRMNEILGRIVEGGLFQYWKKMTENKKKKENILYLWDNFTPLGTEHLQTALFTLLFGFGISLGVFTLEHIIYNVPIMMQFFTRKERSNEPINQQIT